MLRYKFNKTGFYKMLNLTLKFHNQNYKKLCDNKAL